MIKSEAKNDADKEKEDMNNKILCSTGAYIGRENGFDHTLIPEIAKELDCEGLELMMLRAWYDDLEGRAAYLAKSGARFEVIHSDKEIGTLLSNGDAADAEEAIRLFELSCRTGATVGAKKLVLHLWGGWGTDKQVDYNIAALDKLLETARRYEIKMVIENVPCAVCDPLTHWRTIEKLYPEAEFIFDTRFGAFHKQLDEIFDCPWFGSGKIKHMHISDFVGPPGDFKKLRPIPLPGDGIINFNELLPKIKNAYNGSITLESPAINADGSVNTSALNAALAYIAG